MTWARWIFILLILTVAGLILTIRLRTTAVISEVPAKARSTRAKHLAIEGDTIAAGKDSPTAKSTEAIDNKEQTIDLAAYFQDHDNSGRGPTWTMKQEYMPGSERKGVVIAGHPRFRRSYDIFIWDKEFIYWRYEISPRGVKRFDSAVGTGSARSVGNGRIVAPRFLNARATTEPVSKPYSVDAFKIQDGKMFENLADSSSDVRNYVWIGVLPRIWKDPISGKSLDHVLRITQQSDLCALIQWDFGFQVGLIRRRLLKNSSSAHCPHANNAVISILTPTSSKALAFSGFETPEERKANIFVRAPNAFERNTVQNWSELVFSEDRAQAAERSGALQSNSDPRPGFTVKPGTPDIRFLPYRMTRLSITDREELLRRMQACSNNEGTSDISWRLESTGLIQGIDIKTLCL